jgi:Molecular chaperone (small heat shock protein)
MSAVIRRNPISPLTELFDWYNSGGWPETADWPHGGAHALRIEDRLEQDRYVVRAEIPGVDPDKDVQITVDDGVLTISAERHEEVRGERTVGVSLRLLPAAGVTAAGLEGGTVGGATRTASSRSRCRSWPRRVSGTPSR